MPNFQITTHERWDHVVQYVVDAPTLEAAIRMVTSGRVPYTSAEYQGCNPIQEVFSILEVTNNDTNKTIKGEKKLKKLLDNSVG
ncbi:hypothetical protein HUU59_08415 [bacterium]|nr:hypothetical protein [bacterium]